METELHDEARESGAIPAFRLEGMATWRNGARAAYSIIHDDIGNPDADGFFEHALPELGARGLCVGAGVIVSEVERRSLWPLLRAAVDSGHEILNHSLTHQNLVEVPEYEAEIDRARALLWARLGTRRVSEVFIFPYDAWDDAALEHLRQRGYVGARAGDRGVTSAVFPDPLRVCFDTYGERWSVYGGDVLRAYLDAAVAQGGWAVRELHGVQDASWESVPRDCYTRHLDDVVALATAGELWMAPPAEVIRYRVLRDLVTLELVPGRLHVSLPAVLPDMLARDAGTRITAILRRPEGVSLPTAWQQDGEVAVRALDAQRFCVDLDPFAGPVELGPTRPQWALLAGG